MSTKRKQSSSSRGSESHLGEFEQLVLLAILRLDENAYGMKIRFELESAGRSASLGSIYTTLDRLEEKGWISSWVGEPVPERGGRARKYFRIEGTGISALKNSRGTVTRLSKGLETILA